MKTTGVIGTAKNTGKTTTLSFLLKGFISRGLTVCVTGIGYDGEEIDNITNLPKPRLYLNEGIIVATSEKCLANTEAKFDLIRETELRTPLGKIMVVRITNPGLVVIAGPNTKTGLEKIVNILAQCTSGDYCLIDGSLNRISPMYFLDKLIFTTGASRDTNIDKLVKEMSSIEKAFSYKVSSDSQIDGHNIKVIYSDGELSLDTQSLVDDSDLKKLENALRDNAVKIFFPGLISPALLGKNIARLVDKIRSPFEFVLNSPIQLLLSDDFNNVSFLSDKLNKNRIKLSYKHKPELAAITINPFYPKPENFSYAALYIDKDELLNQMKNALNTPVFNIFEPGSENIFELI